LGNKKFQVPTKDNKDGTFSIDWEPEDEGVHKVDVLVGGKPIKGSPFNIDVKPSKLGLDFFSKLSNKLKLDLG